MAVKRIAAETLIELAVETLRKEIQPILPSEHRYTAAMIANALEIVRREILMDGETACWNLLDEVYPEGDGDMKKLALDIRSGRVNAKTVPDLHKKLRAIVVEELTIAGKTRKATRLTWKDEDRSITAWVVDDLPVPARILQQRGGRDHIDLRLKSLR